MQHVHFIGIGGIGMSGLAQALLTRGVRVSGSDPHVNAATDRLAAAGATLYRAQEAANIEAERPDLVVVTAAIPPGNPELQAARRSGAEVVSRAEFLGRLMAGYGGPRIAVAGTHGKTTTTAMLAEVLLAGGLDPTVLVGGEYAPIGGNARIGRSESILTEACEAYESFLSLHPDVTIITNVEADHLDHYGTEERVFESFRRFAGQTAPDGVLVLCGDDAGARRLAATLEPAGARPLHYGFVDEGRAGLWGEDLRVRDGETVFTVRWRADGAGGAAEVLGDLRLRVPGAHNALNALAAAAVGLHLGIEFEAVAAGLSAFVGTGRRFERLGEVNGVLVVDDYAHHPTEIRATLRAARTAYPARRVVALFQPHLYSRTRDFMAEFADALAGADVVLVTDIYAAREQPIEGVRAAELIERLAGRGGERTLLYVPDRAAARAALEWVTRPGDLVLTIGAGDIRDVAEAFVTGEAL